MKKTICALVMSAALSSTASASWIDPNGNYVGPISSVAVNFFEGIGVGLTDGVTCNGSPVVYLPYSTPHYKDILATLVAAQASGQEVRMFRIKDTISTFPGGYAYCTMTSASIGGFPLW
ncbi:hypothetical protein GCM10011487_21870 [Steroidobacter agaridevorans]|uniref:Uncharacterized protein n=1 Tax=Steroidobacter agaridevorans TaxID=2695856 RepID=A0A829YA46_9GAMM|nr:hypothetical protein [Steroidobacter agaridevorans]GFE80187.1 hypothetical protein GCM10011487_21870 [Steroidobacter agaridevorans]GFE89843.1 hypothetical protein GCM10011488_47970 [Steroidobacter agaridevorans]